MTRIDHASGTDRIAEVAAQRKLAADSIVVNVQGDEPLIEPALIRAAAQQLADHADAAIATACCPLADAAQMANSNIVKVVIDRRGYALYFSRAPVPFPRDGDHEWQTSGPFRRHIGLYAYRVGFLKQFVRWAPATLEQLERLEQLRAMAHGATIVVPDALEACGMGIDTPEDLARARALLASARNL
jgi:3-deoxy-manno-octulosonate cytidylyltransferase (CMP-KDO synthetase)